MPYNVKIELESLLKEINQVVRASSIYLFGDEFNERVKYNCTLESQILHQGVKLYG